MKFQITNVNMRYAGGVVELVQVQFTGNDEGRTVNINGYIPLTAEEYAGNESIENLDRMVRQSLADRLLAKDEEPEVE